MRRGVRERKRRRKDCCRGKREGERGEEGTGPTGRGGKSRQATINFFGARRFFLRAEGNLVMLSAWREREEVGGKKEGEEEGRLIGSRGMVRGGRERRGGTNERSESWVTLGV